MSARRRGLLRLSVLLVAVAGVVVLVARSQGGSSGGEQGGMPTVTDSTPAKPTPVRLVARTSPQHLPAPISGEAAVASRDGVLSIGGLDSTPPRPAASSSCGPRTERHERQACSWSHCTTRLRLRSRARRLSSAAGRRARSIRSSRWRAEAPARSSATCQFRARTSRPPPSASARTCSAATRQRSGRGRSANGRRTQLQADRVTAHAGPLRGGRAAGPRDLRVRRRDREWTGLGRDPGGRRLDTQRPRDRPPATGHLPRFGGGPGERIYVLGGRSGATATDRILAFDPASKRISAAGRLRIRS